MIRNFVYLDEEKMYSLSSQIFEGITEYITSENSHEKSESETQKGPVGSGRILADVIKSSDSTKEKKFLHDYSYHLFEKHLFDSKKVLNISTSDFDAQVFESSINDFSFIKVKAKATFNDSNKINELFARFNELGEAIAHVSTFEERTELKEELDRLKSQTKDRNRISKLDAKFKALTNTKKLAKERNLYQDPKFLENLILLTNYGFNEQFELYQHCDEYFFSSCLKREFLRENEDFLVKKYSRKTEREMIVFGLISQSSLGGHNSDDEDDGDGDYSNMKAAIINLVDHLANIEDSISGKQDNEIVIDPIAVYTEV